VLHLIKSQKSLLIFFNAISCLMLLVFAVIVFQQAKKNENYDAWVIHSYQVLGVSHNIVNGAYKIESAYRGYFLTGSKQFLNSVTALKQRTIQDFEVLDKLVADNKDQQQITQKIRNDFIAFQNVLAEHKNIYNERGAAGLLVGDILESQRLMEALQGQMAQFIKVELSHLNDRVKTEEVENSYHTSTIFIGASISIIVLIVANALILLLASSSAKTAERLKDMEENYRLVMESMNDGLYNFKPDTEEITLSPSYRQQLGYTLEEMPDTLDAAFRNIVHPEDKERVWGEVQKYIHRETPDYSVAYRIKHKNGSWIWVWSRGIGSWDKKGNFIRLVGVHTDITAQKKQEEDLRELNQELETFTYIASHDLRSPLVNLKGFSKEIENNVLKLTEAHHSGHIDKEQEKELTHILERDIPEALGFINSSIERMDMLTSAILNLSRIGRRVYKPTKVHVSDVIQRCLNTLKYETNTSSTKVEIGDLPDIYADELAIEQIFSNIIENAVKYLDPNRVGNIQVSGIVQDNNVIYSFKDNGRGIPEKEEDKVFNIFRRARNSGNVRGAGMGLAFVRATIRKMRGKIWYESQPDVGTVFYVSLPQGPVNGNIQKPIEANTGVRNAAA